MSFLDPVGERVVRQHAAGCDGLGGLEPEKRSGQASEIGVETFESFVSLRDQPERQAHAALAHAFVHTHRNGGKCDTQAERDAKRKSEMSCA